MKKLEVMKRIIDCGIVAVVRAESADQALKIAEAVKAGGVEAIEITMTVPGAIDVIKELAKAYTKGEILIGAGTVLDSETARAAMLAGAEFIVSPYFNPDLVRICNRYQKVSMPGAMSIKRSCRGHGVGCGFCKILPGQRIWPIHD